MERMGGRPGRMPSERTWTGLILLGAGIVFVFLLRVSWRRWGDPVVDFGQDLVVPTRISQGAVLYRDLAYNYGPFSPYLNALIFRVFGASLGTMLGSCLVNVALVGSLVVLTARKFVSTPVACLGLAVFLFESVFQHYYANGTFSFLFPYTSSAVHGLLLALGSLYLVLRFVETRAVRDVLGASLLVGLTALTKLELALAPLAALLLTTAVVGMAESEPRRKWHLALAVVLPGLTIVLLCFGLLVASSSVRAVFTENVLRLLGAQSNTFFLGVLGINALGAGIGALLKSSALWIGIAVAAGLAASRVNQGGRVRSLVSGLILGIVGGFAATKVFDPFSVYRGLPLVYAAVAVATLVWSIRDRDNLRSSLAICALATFSLVALLRIVLNAGTFHYGFYLALPAVVFLPVVLGVAVARGRKRLVGEAVAIAVAAACLVVAGRFFVSHSLPAWRLAELEVKGARGVMNVVPTPINYYLAGGMDTFESTIPPGASLMAFPEASVVGFLLDRQMTVKHLVMTPNEVAGREEAILADLQEKQPDYLLFLDSDVTGYGFIAPGVDYAVAIVDYFHASYDTLFGAGPTPYRGEPGGWLLLQKKR